jgi:(p)ppGpp synthase/HD superfamily hydrolase
LVRQFGGGDDQIIAALLRDAVEDCGIKVDEIRTRFGNRGATMSKAAPMASLTGTADAPLSS